MAWTERYVRSDAAGSGDGTTDTNSGANGAFTLAEAITHSTTNTGVRYNVKAGTYANTTTDLTFSGSGTTTAPNWWRGFNTTAGDIDSNNALTKPAITFTSGRFIPTGSFQMFSCLSFSGAQTSNGQARITTGANMWFDRCRFECTAASANGSAVSVTAAEVVFTRCWFKATSSAVTVNAQGSGDTFIGCAFEGGTHGLTLTGTMSVVVAFCAFNNCGGDAIRSTGTASRVWALCNTVYSAGSDGLDFTVAPTLGVVVSNILSESAAYGVTNSSGTSTAKVIRLFNDFHANTSGVENGFGDWPSVAEQSESASPFTNAAGGDLSLLSTSNAKANGVPGAFENQSYASYLDIGAVQRQEFSARARSIIGL